MAETRVELLRRIYRLEETLDALFDTLKARDRTIDGLMAELESRRHPPTPIHTIERSDGTIGASWEPT